MFYVVADVVHDVVTFIAFLSINKHAFGVDNVHDVDIFITL